MSFDLATYLVKNAEIQTTYNDGVEVVIRCDRCDVDRKDEWRLWVNVEKHSGVCYKCRRRLVDDVAIVQYVEGCSFREACATVREGTPPDDRLREAIAGLFPKREKRADAVEEVTLPREFIPGWSAPKLPAYFLKRGLTKRHAEQYLLGWCESGFYKRRLIVPVFDLEEKLATFVARYMGKKPPPTTLPDGTKKKGRKVLYPKHSRTSKVIFNEAGAAEHETVVITEGVFDAMRVGEHAVAILGKSISQTQMRHLVSLGQERRLVVMLDADAREEAEELASELAELCPGVYLAALPDGRGDPGECSGRELRRAVDRARGWGGSMDRLTRALAGL